MKRSLVLLLDFLLVVVSLAAFSTVRDKAALPMDVFASHLEDPDQPFKTGKSSGPISEPGPFLVNGHAVHTQAELEFILDRYKPGTLVSVKHGYWMGPREVRLVQYYSNTYFAAHVLVGLAFFFLGLLVYLKRPHDRGALYCHWSTVSVGVAVMTTWGHYDTQFGWTHIVRYVFAAAYCVRPVILLHFTLVFPVEKISRRYRVLAVPYAIATILAVVQIVTFENAVSGDAEAIRAYASSFGYAALFSMVLSLTAVGSFVHSYFISREYSDRRKLRWTLAGFGAALISYVCLWQIPIALKQEPLLNESTMLLSTLIAPVAFTIAILRYNLFDIDHILSRASTYVAVLGITFVLYALVLGTLGKLLGQQFSFTGEAFAYICAIALVGVLLEPVRNRVQNVVDRYFFRARYDTRLAQKEIYRVVTEALTREDLISSVRDKLQELLQPKRIYILERVEVETLDAGHGSSVLAGTADIVEAGARVYHWSAPYPLTILIRSGASTVVGALVMERKRSGQRYSIEDVDLLEYTAHQMSLVYERLDLMQALVERQLEAQRLKSISEFKTQVLNSITHDLKTPLSSIKMYAQLVERGAPTSAENTQNGYLEIIRGESDRLTSLIDNVLDHARLERGEIFYDLRETDVNDVIQRALTTVRYLLELQQFHIELDLSEAPLRIMGDASMLHNVLINLITNAMKYSLGVRWIRIEARAESGMALVRVIDKGTGIAAKDQEAIFDPFYRVEGQKGLQAKGVGLGLANVRSIVEGHRGSICVASEIDQGSTFTIRIPLI